MIRLYNGWTPEFNPYSWLTFSSPQEPDVEKLEKKINCGQIEEVIFQVGDWWCISLQSPRTLSPTEDVLFSIGRICAMWKKWASMMFWWSLFRFLEDLHTPPSLKSRLYSSWFPCVSTSSPGFTFIHHRSVSISVCNKHFKEDLRRLLHDRTLVVVLLISVSLRLCYLVSDGVFPAVVTEDMAMSQIYQYCWTCWWHSSFLQQSSLSPELNISHHSETSAKYLAFLCCSSLTLDVLEDKALYL